MTAQEQRAWPPGALCRFSACGFSNAGYEYAIHEPLAGATHIDATDSQGTHVADVTCNSATDTLTLTTTMKRFERLGIYR